MKKWLMVLSASVFLSSGGTWQAAKGAYINFDLDPTSAPIASGTVIDNVYSSLGVTFSSILVQPPVTGTASAGHSAYALQSGAPHSSPNVLGIAPDLALWDSRFGAAVVTFAADQQDVGIYGAAVPFVEGLLPNLARPFLTAYDSSNSFIGAVLYPLAASDANYGTYQQMIFHSNTGANIHSIHLGSQQPSQFNGSNIVYGAFDDLAFGADVTDSQSSWNLLSLRRGPGTGNVEPVPEPGTLLLLGSGLAGLVGYARKRGKG